MFTYRQVRALKRLSIIITLSLSLSACKIPIPGLPTQAPTIIPVIPDTMLTAAVATISAHLNPQDTLQTIATEPVPTLPLLTEIPTEPLPTSEAQSLPATQVQPTPSATSFQLVTPTTIPKPPVEVTAIPQSDVQAEVIATVLPVTIVPLSPQVVEYGAQFKIRNINLHPCADGYNAIFKIYNQSSGKLESLSLHIQDLSTGAVLLGPWESDAPFMNTDRTCATGGIDVLNSGQTLFLGNNLGGSNLSGHTIRTTILLCSKEALKGSCTQKVVDFIVP